ncbi:MAG: ABC transporter substrate-binding protein [Lachnospiraceae bacterium]|nr:ABC transporter substrate-binding protein [Lachnospiraceae bacterium]
MAKIVALVFSLLLMIAAFSACIPDTKPESTPEESVTESIETAAPSEESEEEPSSEDIVPKTAVDHAGNEITVPEEINRIVVCDIYPLPSILTVFFDSAEKIVGMAGPSMVAAKNSLLSELYPAILDADTSFINGTEVNIEELLKLNPDIVFYNAGNKALGQKLKEAGLTGFAMSAGKWGYDALETLDQWIATFDQLFPKNAKAEIVEKYGKDVQALVNERIGKLSEKSSALFLFQYNENQVVVNGRPSFGSWWSEAIGLNNTVSEKTEANSLPVTMEEVYAMDPDILFITNFNTASVDDILNNAVGSYDWSPIKAVKNHRVYKMPLGMYRSYTSGVDSPVALLWLAKAAYPEAFEDVDITSYTKDYYSAVFGITLTDDQANSIFSPDAAAGKMN